MTTTGSIKYCPVCKQKTKQDWLDTNKSGTQYECRTCRHLLFDDDARVVDNGRLPEPKELIWIEAADHFFSGALDQFEDAVYAVTQTTNFSS